MTRIPSQVWSIPRSPRGWVVVVVSILLWSVFPRPSDAKVTRANHPATGSTGNQILTLDLGKSVNFSSLTGAHGLSLQIGDKLFSDFSFKYSDGDRTTQNDLKSSAISVTALATDIGSGLSLTGPFTAAGNACKNLTICYSVAVTDLSHLISDVHLSCDDSVCGKGFSSIVEKVFAGSASGEKVAQLEVLNPGKPNPVFQDLAILTQPREELYIEEDIKFGGGRLGKRNRSLLLTLDDLFSESAQVPEPSTLALSALGLVALLCAKRRTAA